MKIIAFSFYLLFGLTVITDNIGAMINKKLIFSTKYITCTICVHILLLVLNVLEIQSNLLAIVTYIIIIIITLVLCFHFDKNRYLVTNIDSEVLNVGVKNYCKLNKICKFDNLKIEQYGLNDVIIKFNSNKNYEKLDIIQLKKIVNQVDSKPKIIINIAYLGIGIALIILGFYII